MSGGVSKMEDFKCTKCRKPHESEAKFCYFCGADLEDAILEYKQQHLPVKFEQKIPPHLIEQEAERRRTNEDNQPRVKFKPTKEMIILGILTTVFSILGSVLILLVLSNLISYGTLITWQIVLGIISLVGGLVCGVILFSIHPNKKSCFIGFCSTGCYWS